MTLATVVLVGAGGHARSCIDVIEQDGTYAVAGVFASAAERGKQVLGYPVIGTDEELPQILIHCSHALVGVGQIKTPEPRIRLFERLQQCGFRIPTIISPRAYVSKHATLGEGTIVLHGAVVNAGAIVGRNCIINSQSLVEHDATIGDHCHVATAATVNGGAHIGMGTFIGSGSLIRECVSVGERCVVGMGQMVLFDCPAGTQIVHSG